MLHIKFHFDWPRSFREEDLCKLCMDNSGDGNDMNPALPDTSMKLGRYVYKHELFEIFSLANQNYSNFQDGGSKFQDGCQNKY